MGINLKNNEFVGEFFAKAKDLIEYAESFKDLKGEKKKEKVVALMDNWTVFAIDKLPLNKVLKWLLKKALINYMPAIVQAAFNLVAAKVNGITK